MSTSKVKLGLLLAGAVAAGGGAALKFMGKPPGGELTSVGAKDSDSVRPTLTTEATLAKQLEATSAAEALEEERDTRRSTEWLEEATWVDVKRHTSEQVATEGASLTTEELARDVDSHLLATTATNPTFAFVPTSSVVADLEATNRSVLAEPSSLQVLLNARANPLVLAAVRDGNAILAPDDTKVPLTSIHDLCHRANITCLITLAETRDSLVQLEFHYDMVERARPGTDIRDWQEQLARRLDNTSFSMSATQYSVDNSVDALLGFGRNSKPIDTKAMVVDHEGLAVQDPGELRFRNKTDNVAREEPLRPKENKSSEHLLRVLEQSEEVPPSE